MPLSDKTPPSANPRPFSRAQALENAAFLAELRRTGNAREAARRLGAHRAKFTKRRARHAEFAAQWQAALDQAAARLSEDHPHLRLRHANGRLQLRRARPDALGPDAQLTFLAGLSLGLDVRLAAESTGFSHAAFYHHRHHDPDFAAAWHRIARSLRLWTEFDGAEPSDAAQNDPAAMKPWPYLPIDEARDGHRREIYEVVEIVYGPAKQRRRSQRRA